MHPSPARNAAHTLQFAAPLVHDDDPIPPRPKRQSQQAAARACGTYLESGLGWLRGYPTGGESAGDPGERQGERAIAWRRLRTGSGSKEGHGLRVDGERLRASFYTLRRARTRFPKALAQVVGDVGAFERAVEARLELLQGAVHRGVPLPDAQGLAELMVSLPGASARDLAALGRVEPELLWLHWDDPRAALAAMGRLEPWQTALEKVRSALGPHLAQQLRWQVIASLEAPGDRLRRLRAILEYEPAWTVQVTAKAFLAEAKAFQGSKFAHGRFQEWDPEFIERVRSQLRAVSLGSFRASPTGQEPPPIGEGLVQCMLADTRAPVQELFASVLAPGYLMGWIGDWQGWWPKAKDAASAACVLLDLLRAGSLKGRALKDLEKDVDRELGQVIETAPRVMEPGPMLEVARRVASQFAEGSVTLIEEIADLLEGPGMFGASAPLEFLKACDDLDQTFLTEQRIEELFVKLLARLRAIGNQSPQVALQRATFARVAVKTLFECEWRATEVPWERVDVGLEALQGICLADSGTPEFKKLIRSWRFAAAFEGGLAEVDDPHEIRRLMDASGHQTNWNPMRVAARLFPRDPSTGRVPESSWKSIEKLDRNAPDTVDDLLKATRTPALKDLVREALEAGVDLPTVARFTTLLMAQRPSHWVEPTGPARPGTGDLAVPVDHWESFVPVSLVGDVETLAGLYGRASAAGALSPELRDPAEMKTELGAMEARLRDPAITGPRRLGISKRMETLRGRLESPPSPTANEIAACRARLRRSIARGRVERWTRALVESAVEELEVHRRGEFAKVLNEEAACDPLLPKVLGAVLGLRRRSRELGLRLLVARAGAHPWDLRDDPLNLRWETSAAEAGLDLAPWWQTHLEGPVADPSGTEILFTFEDDPLEVLKMGHWFDTCLAPGNMNFFSTIANAADGNKRLVVGRAPDGVVRVRCLVALTDRFHLMGFHLYAHEHGEWATARIQGILKGLAESMGTMISVAGKVPTLISSRWYDDGPQDFTGLLETLDESSPLGVAVEAAPPGEASRIVAEALGRDVVEASLEQILNLPLFQGSARAASFAEFLTASRLPRSMGIRMASRFQRSNPALAAELVGQLGPASSLHRLNLDDWERVTLAETLRVIGQPTLALRILRACDDPHSHGDKDVQSQIFHCLLALGRDDQAEALRRRHLAGE